MIKAAVIGAGHMGSNHVRVYAEMEAVELVAVADPDEASSRKATHSYRLNLYTDYRRMLDREKPDVVSLAVPTARHAEVAREVIGRGVNLLIEKPLASTLAQGQHLIEIAERNKVKLMVGHIERFNPAIIEIKRRLDRQNVGVVLDLATHDIDVMHYLLGSGVERVYAEFERKAHGSCEDLLSGLLRFRNGVIGVLDVNWLTPTKVRQLAVLGEGGMYLADYLTQDVCWYKNSSVTETRDTLSLFRGVWEGDMVKAHFQKKEPLRAELESFVAAVLEDREPLISGHDGLVAMELAQKLIESGRRHVAIQCGRNGSEYAEIGGQKCAGDRWSRVHR